LHERLVVHLYPSRAVCIQPLERLGKLLDDHAASHESVKRDAQFLIRSNVGSILSLDKLDQLRGQVEPELGESLRELLAVDGPAPIAIEMPEHPLPVLDVLPETGELVESDRSAPIRVEDRHEELDGVEVERRPISIDERLLQLMRRDASTAIGVDRGEPLP